VTEIEAECLASLAGGALRQLLLEGISAEERECRKAWHKAEFMESIDPSRRYFWVDVDFGDQWENDFLGDITCLQ
jgi:hypothetical protein